MTQESKDEQKNKLASWLDRHNHTQAWLGRYLGVTRQSVHAWVTGKTLPEPKYAYAIVDISGEELSLEDLIPRGAGVRRSPAPAPQPKTSRRSRRSPRSVKPSCAARA